MSELILDPNPSATFVMGNSPEVGGSHSDRTGPPAGETVGKDEDIEKMLAQMRWEAVSNVPISFEILLFMGLTYDAVTPEWQRELFEEINALSILEDDYDGEGARSISPEAIIAAKELIQLLYSAQRIQSNNAGPMSDGRVEVEAEGTFWEMAFWVASPYQVDYIIERGGEKRSGRATIFDVIEEVREALG